MSRDYLMKASVDKKKGLQKAEEKKVNKNEISNTEKGAQSTEKGTQSIENKNLKSPKEDLKNQKGWNHSWVSPNRIYLDGGLAARDVVPGPFISPRLVKVTPFVVNSTKQLRKEDHIRCGIPDAWGEYLSVHGLSSEIDKKMIEKKLALGYNNLRVTDFVWNELGLPLTQGIPDPWKPVLSDNDFCVGDERADICLCKPPILKELQISKCRSPRKKIVRKGKCKATIQECQKTCQNFEPCRISEQIPRDKKKYKSREKLNCACNRNIKNFLPKTESQHQNSECLPAPNNTIQCDISGKITLHTQQGKSFVPIGSLKLNYGQNGNNVCEEQQQENHQFLPQNLTKTSKIREKILNFEPKKQFSKLKNIFNGKRDDQIEKDFGEETKLICCKCSCPCFKVLTEETLVDNTLFQEPKINNLNKHYSALKTQIDNKTERKSHKIRCDINDCKKCKKKKDHHSEEKLQKGKPSVHSNHVKVADNEDEKSLHVKDECGCEMQHTGDSSDSGNHADISDLSKRANLSSRESLSQSVTSLTYMTRLNQKSSEKWSQEFRVGKKKETHKKQNVCTPCGKKPTRLTQKNFDDRQRSVSYAPNVAISDKEKIKFGKINSTLENTRESRLSSGTMIPNLERRTDLDRHLKGKTIENDEFVIKNLNDNFNNKLINTKENKKSRKCSQEECRRRGGKMGIEFWSSDSEPDKREIRKSAWCEEEENKADSFRKISDQDRSDTALDNAISSKVFSSLLEESLDLISEPIGRRKSSENFKISKEKSPKNENKCYAKYCFDHTKDTIGNRKRK